MLRITVPETELFDETTQSFSIVEGFVLELEHSLVSLSKWESKFQTPFLVPGKKTSQQIIDYVKAMILTPEISPDVISRLSFENLSEINDYIDSKQSATTFGSMPDQKGRSEIITSELIYYWMVTFNIPFECETWHLNRLFSLIRICNLKNGKQKKMSQSQLAQRNRELNEQRLIQLNTTG